MSSSQAVAASLMGPPPPDAVPERSRFDRLDDRHQHHHHEQSQRPKTPTTAAAAGQDGEGAATLPPAATNDCKLSSDDGSDRQHPPQSDNEKQAAATTLLAQLLSSQTAAATAVTPSQNTDATATAAAATTTAASTSIENNSNNSLPDPPVSAANGDSSAWPNSSEQGNYHQQTTVATDAGAENDFHGLPKMGDLSASDALPALDMQTDTSMLGALENVDFKTSDLNAHSFSDFTALATTPVNPRDAIDHNGLLASGAAYYGDSPTMNGGGPTPRIVGYPDFSNSTDVKGREGSESVAGSEPRIQAFAKLEFDDGHFYVNTYSFILGRDVRAARAAFQREYQAKQNNRAHSSTGHKTRTPSRVKREGSAYMGSVISDKGGIMGFDPDIPQNGPPQMSWKSSNSSADQAARPLLHISHGESQANSEPREMTDYNALAMQSLQRGHHEPKRVDTLSLLPSPEACPTIPIHPPVPAHGGSSHRAISRKHVKIAYNFHKNVFEMEVIGRNGAFMGADWLAPGQVRPLHSGDFIQIGGVRVRFLLPDVPIGDTGADVTPSSPPEMEKESERSEADESVKAKGKSQPRPDSKATATEPATSPPPATTTAGKKPAQSCQRTCFFCFCCCPHLLVLLQLAPEDPSTATVKVEKRKYTKRKKPDSTPGETVMQSIEGGAAGLGANMEIQQHTEPVRPPAPKKRKPSRSPSPDYPPESFYTPKELAKPPYNYAVLIFDALSESPTPMTLKQIYRALKLKYPYFRFKCETEGWTSSVRHNLNGNTHLFMHAERDGKGWSWKLLPGASVDKEKKRRPSPPPVQDVSSNSQQRFLPPNTGPGAPYIASPGQFNNRRQYPPYQQPPANTQFPPQQQQQQQPQQQQQQQAPLQAPSAAQPSQPVAAAKPPPLPPPPPPPAAVAASPAHPPALALPPQLLKSLPPALSVVNLTPYRSPYILASPSFAQPQQRPSHQQPIQPHPPPPTHPPVHHQQQQPRPPPPQMQQPHHPQPAPQQQQPPPNQYRFHNQILPPNHGQPHRPPQQSHPPPPQHTQAPPPPPLHNIPVTSAPATQPSHPPSSTAPAPAQQNISVPAPVPTPVQPPMQKPGGMDPAFLARANQAIDNFEAVLIEDYEDKDYIRKVLRSARDRVLHNAKESSFPGGETKDETVIIDALRGIIGSLNGQDH
ncbi:forkhead domain-containing protein [Nannizzia gypsea CBS 118893]|uniref:Forkhead domain-containing protein n=1 Tax=Arthroderma gypseum (strain ATCC MYA-4604 / CBS 118893) TaxID=535722 RepID=E5R0T6_ARTGP|nr:forkhead domain-containing protein [Nannizzia gypsea CBS 118893]EFQ97592.1 forkhead domain-containing protein [Nannizzia gypsea CBS 118893]